MRPASPSLPTSCVSNRCSLNLSGNAVKFTDQSGTVRLAASLLARSATDISMKFSVSNTGIGISPEQIPNLFTAFEQGDSSIAKYKGAGLGLAISQNIVRAMGGKILVDSVRHAGSTFHFTITLPTADIQMPVMNGYLSTTAIRNLPPPRR